MLISGVEVGDLDREMPDPGVLESLRRPVTLGRNDLDHRSVGGLDEDVAVIAVVDLEPQMIHVPLRQLFRALGSDGGVFQSNEHSNSILAAGLGPNRQWRLRGAAVPLRSGESQKRPARGQPRARGAAPQGASGPLRYQQDLAGGPPAFECPVRFT